LKSIARRACAEGSNGVRCDVRAKYHMGSVSLQ